MRHEPQLFLREVFVFLCLAATISAAGAEASSAQGKVYRITVEGSAYSVRSDRDQVTITPAGGEATVTLTAGQISLSSLNGGAPGPATAVMNDPVRAKVVRQAAAMAVAALAAVAAGSLGADSGDATAAIELDHTLDLLMQSLPSHVAAVIESAAHAVPQHKPTGLIVGAAVKAAIASGLPAEWAGGTMAAAAARGAAAADPSRANILVLAIARSAVLAAIESGLAEVRVQEIVRAIARGAASGAIQGMVNGRESVAGKDATSGNMVRKVEEISRFVAEGASGAVQELYGTTPLAITISQAAVWGAERGAAHGIYLTESKIGSLKFDYERITRASIAGSQSVFILIGTPATPVDPGANVSPSR